MLCTYIFRLNTPPQIGLNDIKESYDYADFTTGSMGAGVWETQFYNKKKDDLEDGYMTASLVGAVLYGDHWLVDALELVNHPSFPAENETAAIEKMGGIDFSNKVDSPYSISDNVVFLPRKCINSISFLSNSSSFTCRTTHIRPLYLREDSQYKFTLTNTMIPSRYVMVTVGYVVSCDIEGNDRQDGDTIHSDIAERTLESYDLSQSRWKPFIHENQSVVMEPSPHHHMFSDTGMGYGPYYKEFQYEEGLTNTEIVCNNFLYCGQEHEFMDNMQGFLPVYDLPWFFQMPCGAIEYLGYKVVNGEKPVLHVASFTILPNKSDTEEWADVMNSWMGKYKMLSLSGSSWYKNN